MTIKTKYDKDKNLTLCTISGDVTEFEILDAIKTLFDFPELTNCILWDTRSANFAKPFNKKQIDQIIIVLESNRKRYNERCDGKSAIVVNNDLNYGICRMLEMHIRLEGFPVVPKPFRTMKDAVDYLTKPSNDSQV
jgi:hypothetical protein